MFGLAAVGFVLSHRLDSFTFPMTISPMGWDGMERNEDRLLVDANDPRGSYVSTFNISLVVEDLELADEDLDRLFGILPDAVPASVAGVVTVTAPVDARDASAAVIALADALTECCPSAVAIRVDQDLVAVPDIAERVGRSRESIRLLADAKRGPGGFPDPIGVVGDGIRIWPWAAVAEWFATALGHESNERGISPEEAAAVDAVLASRNRRVNSPDEVQVAIAGG